MFAKFKIISSGSKGNSYILESKNSYIIIEAGISLKDIYKWIDKSKKHIATIISHEHKDHSKFQEHYKYLSNLYNKFYHNQILVLQDFTILAIYVKHDVENYSFLIHHNDFGKFLYITDTNDFDYYIPNLNYIAIEANYSYQILEKNIENLSTKYVKHIINDHLSFERAIEIINLHENKNLKAVFFLHLSEINMDVSLIEDFKKKKNIQFITTILK